MSTTQQPLPVAHVKLEPPETTATTTATSTAPQQPQASMAPVAAPPPPPPAAAPVGVVPQAPAAKVSPAPAPVPVPSASHAAAVAAAQAAARAAPVPAAAPAAKPKPSKKSSKAAAAAEPSPQVTMATAATASSSASSKGGENTGRWTAEEHRLFLQGLEQHGKGWKKIASLIKSRTVVQIRTHAQKYFQKLAKARQNGEEGEVSMEGRGGAAGAPGAGIGAPGAAGGPGSAQAKRRRQTSGTKRRAISSVVTSAQREGKKQAAAAVAAASAGGTPSSTPPPQPPLPAVAPALAPFVVQGPPQQAAPLSAPGQIAAHQHPGQVVQTQAAPAQAQAQPQPQVPGITTAHGTISGAALEDSLFRFLTPVTGDSVHPLPVPAPQVNDVARKAGANPIVLPSEAHAGAAAPASQAAAAALAGGGDISPTGVADLSIYPTWTEAKEPPAWYSSGRDVDELLHEADALDWLADSGDLHETYVAPQQQHQYQQAAASAASVKAEGDVASLCSENTEPNPVPGVRSAAPSTSDLAAGGDSTSAMPPLPSLFGSSADVVSSGAAGVAEPLAKKQKVEPSSSTASLFASATEAADATMKHAGAVAPDADDHLAVFDAHFDEQAFVSALLDNNGESSASLPTLQ